jgi:hypothetical protein
MFSSALLAQHFGFPFILKEDSDGRTHLESNQILTEFSLILSL